MLLSCQSIPLDAIKSTTDWNLHPWELGAISSKLREDLALNGVIHPPLVIADSEKSFTLVSGAKRLEFIRRFICPSQINCMIIEKDVPASSILNVILADQNYASELSLAEKARFMEIACRSMEIEDILTSFGKKLRLKRGRSTISNLLKILQQDVKFITEIHAGRLQERMVSDLISLPEETDRLTLVQLFKLLGMGDGKQKRFFSLIRDIAFREGISITSYLQKKDVTEILDHKEMNIPQKVHHLGNLLQHEMNPASSMAEEVFTKKIKSLHLPANCTLSHSPSFEKDEVTLSITFKNFADCEQYLGQKRGGSHP